MRLTDRVPYQAIVDRPTLCLPNGKRLAVWVIVNVEDWGIEGPMPRTVLPPPMGTPYCQIFRIGPGMNMVCALASGDSTKP